MKNVPILLVTVTVLGMMLGASFVSAAESSFYLPESKLTVKDRVRLLSIDDRSLRNRENLVLTLNKPTVRKEPVLTPERGDLTKPDSMASHFYGTVLHDAGKFRMWYYAVSLMPDTEKTKFYQGPVCYAESDDGIHWVKPNLGQVEIKGSTDNNAIKLSDEMTQCAAVVIDEDDPDPKRRYKMLYMALHNTWVFRTATSADGIHWEVPDRYPTEKFLEMGSFYRFGDRWVVHGQGIGKDANGNPEGRQGYASTSTDFVNWENQNYLPTFRLPEPEDVSKRGLTGDYPQVHLGVGASGFGNVAVGLYGIWHNPAEGKKRTDGWYGAGIITCELGLVLSNDGVAFREPVKGAVYISGDESPVTPVPGIDDPTILCQANGILNVGDQTLIYHGRWRNATISGVDYYAEVALATLPRDRWGTLQLADGSKQGSVLSAPITLPKNGCTISLNAAGTENITVELTNENGVLIPAYSGENRGAILARQGLDSVVQWADNGLAKLAGKTVRVKLGLHSGKAKLYAVYLDGKN